MLQEETIIYHTTRGIILIMYSKDNSFMNPHEHLLVIGLRTSICQCQTSLVCCGMTHTHRTNIHY